MIFYVCYNGLLYVFVVSVWFEKNLVQCLSMPLQGILRKVFFFYFEPLRGMSIFALTAPQRFNAPAWVICLSGGAPAWVMCLSGGAPVRVTWLSGSAPARVICLSGVAPVWAVFLITFSPKCHLWPLAV